MGTVDIHSMIHISCGAETETTLTHLGASGYYTAILLADTSGCGSAYGWQSDDYTDGTLTFRAPGCHTIYSPRAIERALAFHPDIFLGTPLEKELSGYTFFGYRTNEALHLSSREKHVIGDCLDAIEGETCHSADGYSKQVLCKRFELLFDYGTRFYERQFITRCLTVLQTLEHYAALVSEHVTCNGFATCTRLTAEDCSERLGLSEAYFRDMLEHETGMSHTEYVDRQCIVFAQKLLRETKYPLDRIASVLGFPSARHFSTFFKKVYGCTPNTFRHCC